MQQPTQIQNIRNTRLTSLEANSFQNLATYISFINWVIQQITYFLQVSPRKIENLISGRGALIGAWIEKFFEKINWGALIRDLRVSSILSLYLSIHETALPKRMPQNQRSAETLSIWMGHFDHLTKNLFTYYGGGGGGGGGGRGEVT